MKIDAIHFIEGSEGTIYMLSFHLTPTLIPQYIVCLNYT